MPALNVDLLDRTLAYIEAHPDEHDQGTWRCGTAMCFAGHAAVLDGGVWAGPEHDELVAMREDPAEVRRLSSIGEVVHVEDRARRVLGLTGEEAYALFYRAATLDDVRAGVAAIRKRAL